MEWGRTISKDIVIAHHEAAHAVTAEYLAPGCVAAASIEGECEGFEGVNTTGLGAIGQVVWCPELFPTEFELGIAIWASRPGEQLVAQHVDPNDTTFKGDDIMFDQFVFSSQRAHAALRAEEIVRGNEGRIRRLAQALLEYRELSGAAVRYFIDAGPIHLESQGTQGERMAKVFKGPDPKPVKKPKKGKK